MWIDVSEICHLTESIWDTLLGMEVERSPEPLPLGEGFYSGVVRIDGAWKGEVSLDCGPDLARQVAAVMFGGEAESTVSAEIYDALGELANMLGGNLKTLLPGPSKLSLPQVSEEAGPADDRLRAGQGELIVDVTFLCQGLPLRVTLLQSAEQNAMPADAEAPVQDLAVLTLGPREAATPEMIASECAPDPDTEIEAILAAAVAKGQRLVREAEARAASLAEGGEVADGARADALIAIAEARAEEIRRAARDYAESLLDRLQERLDELAASIDKSRKWLRSESIN